MGVNPPGDDLEGAPALLVVVVGDPSVVAGLRGSGDDDARIEARVLLHHVVPADPAGVAAAPLDVHRDVAGEGRLIRGARRRLADLATLQESGVRRQIESRGGGLGRGRRERVGGPEQNAAQDDYSRSTNASAHVSSPVGPAGEPSAREHYMRGAAALRLV